MSDGDDLEVGRIEWTGAELNLVEAVLSPGASRAPAAPPDWLDRSSWGLLAILSGPNAARIAAELGDAREADGDRWLVFQAVPEVGGTFAEAPCRAFLSTLRARLTPADRALVCVDRGALTAGGLAGPLADRAAAHFRANHHRSGLCVAPELVGLDRAPVVELPRRPRAWAQLAWIGAAAAAVVAGVLWLRAPVSHTGPDARIFVMGGGARVERGPMTWREADPVTVAVEGRAGTHFTLLLLDSDDQVVTPVDELVGATLTAQPALAQLEFDARPGRERFMVLATRAPTDLAPLLARVNGAAVDRAGRLAALRAALAAALPEGSFRLRLAEEIEHGK